MECNAKRNRPYFFDAPIRIILLSRFEISCCCGLDFPLLRVRKIRNSLLSKVPWRLWKAGTRLWRRVAPEAESAALPSSCIEFREWRRFAP